MSFTLELRPLASTALLMGACLLANTSHAEEGAVPAFQTTGALRYSCGGIGLDESTTMRGEMTRYPLSLLFARKDGDYLADVAVHIQGASGAPMEFKANGPVCLLQLPAGRYTVRATSAEGVTHSQTVDVQRNGHMLDFRY
jgi:hypothetical protein